MKLILSKLTKKMSSTNKNKKENNFGGAGVVVDVSVRGVVVGMLDVVVGIADVVVGNINSINFKR